MLSVSDLEKEIVEQKLTPDIIGIERAFVEGYCCPQCRRNFAYRGFIKPNDETVCYGVCEDCAWVKKFYFNSPRVAAGKRKFSKTNGRAG